MSRTFSLFPAAVLLLCVCLPAAAQKFQPKTIQFKGDPEYSDQELLSAAGLKKGVVLTSAEMNDHSRQLMDSGVFENLTYKFDGLDLVYLLSPSNLLYPVRLENLPITGGKDLDVKLHERFPLYHGKVPPEGGLLESVRTALEDMLAAEEIKATVSATPFGAMGANKVSAMNFSITSPPVRIGAVQLQGVSPAMQAKIKAVADHAVGSPYDTNNAATNLEHAFESYYADEGYAAVKVHATRAGEPVLSPSAIDIPFSVAVEEGPLYKLGAIHLPPDALVTQADIEKATAAQPGSQKQGITVRTIWITIASKYKSKGYLECAVKPHPQFNDAAGTVDYAVDIAPGPVYHMALLKFENVSDDLRKLLMRNWQMLPGDPFDETYVAGFMFSAQKSDPILQRTLAAVKYSYEIRADPSTHDVNLVIKLEKIR